MEAPTSAFTKPEKKWTMGKYLRKLKGLRKKVQPNQFTELANPPQAKWLQFYESQGLILNKITFARFYLKNGLPYDGMVSTDNINPLETLIRVPKHLMLSTRDAYMSELMPVFQENPDYFWNFDEIDEDLVLIVFILHEFSKGKDSKFHHLISTLPRDQDVLCFWPDIDIDSFEDMSLKRKAWERINRIRTEYASMKEIVDKYPCVFKCEIFTFENFSWIYCLLLNRSFGATCFSYVHMIPIAENLNHDCTDTTFEKITENVVNTKKITMNDSNNKTVEENQEIAKNENITTSEGDSEERETDQEEDFFEFKEFLVTNALTPDSREKEHEIKNSEEILLEKLMVWFKENFASHELFSLIFITKAFSYIQELQKAGFLNKDLLIKSEEITQKSCEYKKELELFLKKVVKTTDYKEFCQDTKWKEPEMNGPEPPKDVFNKDFPQETFDFVDFSSSKNEFYEKNSQVFYCYGRKSNRSLIFCYGMCVEYNKYGCAFLKLDYRKYVEFCGNSLKNVLKPERIPKFKKFKLKYTKFEEELLVFFKLMLFDFSKNQIKSIFYPKEIELELLAIDAIIEFLDHSYQSKYTMKENEEILLNKSTTYHQYFAAVYRLERQRITKLHKNLMEILKEILMRIKQGFSYSVSIEIVDFLEDEEEFQRNRYLLFDYLKKMDFILS